jgi:hypothetical protein
VNTARSLHEILLIRRAESRNGDCVETPEEGAMHIHANQMNMNSASLYSAAGAENAAAAQRAADVRRKLMKSASDIEGVASPDEAFMIGQWTDSRHSQVQSDDQYHASASGKDPDFG